MRKFFFAVVLLLAILFVITSFSQIQEISRILQAGNWIYIGLGILAEVLLLVTMAATYHSIYQLMGIEESLPRLFQLATAAFFVSIVTPATGGVPAMAVFLGDGLQRGHKSGRVMTAWAVYVVFDYVGLLVITALGLLVLIRRNNIQIGQIIAFAILLILALFLMFILYLATKEPDRLGRVLAALARFVNRISRAITHKDYLVEERAHSFARDAADGMAALRSSKRNLASPMLLSLATKLLLVLILLLVFLAFNTQFTIGTLIAGFSIGYLFVIVSPTPSGIGIVEGVLTLTLHSLGVALEAATVIAISFRGLTFWLPFLIGVFTFRRVSVKK